MQQLAKTRAVVPALAPLAPSGVPTYVWIGLGALVVGGAAWWFLIRQPEAAA